MRILAFNTAHDSSVCAINDGKLEFFCKEERLSKVKRDKNPFKSLELYKSLNFGKIDHVLYAVASNIEKDVESIYYQYIRKNFNVEMENFSALLHHKCHASIAYNNSKFEQALVFVIDRNGSFLSLDKNPVARESESVFLCDKNFQLIPIYKSFWLLNGMENQKANIKYNLENFYKNCEIVVNSHLGIVKVYEAATTLIGQNILENGKTMGLSSYGNDINEPLFINDVPLDHLFYDIGAVYFNNLETKIIDKVDQKNYQFYADKAKQVQIQTQEVCLNLIRKYVKLTGINNVCIVGGYALNVVANNYYIKNLPDVNFYFEPLADDTGVSVGAAILKYKEVTNSKHVEPLIDNFYHYYDKTEKINCGKSASIEDLCDILISQKSLAIFEGNPESGPRALGHRSILFDARNKNAKEIVNCIKKREWYRPFAGVVLLENFKEYFETLGIKESPHMTINFTAKEKTKEIVPGIVHIDNTSRMQTISDGFLFKLLSKFNEKTNCPILLNTSFNLAGAPLVQTKKDALETLKNSSLDALYFVDDNLLILKSDIN